MQASIQHTIRKCIVTDVEFIALVSILRSSSLVSLSLSPVLLSLSTPSVARPTICWICREILTRSDLSIFPPTCLTVKHYTTRSFLSQICELLRAITLSGVSSPATEDQSNVVQQNVSSLMAGSDSAASLYGRL